MRITAHPTDDSRYFDYALTLFEETSTPDEEKTLYLYSIRAEVVQERPLQFQLIPGSICMHNTATDEEMILPDQVFSNQGYFPTDEEWQFFFKAVGHGRVSLKAKVVDRQSYSYNMNLTIFDYKNDQDDKPIGDSLYEQQGYTNGAENLTSESLAVKHDDIVLIQLMMGNNESNGYT